MRDFDKKAKGKGFKGRVTLFPVKNNLNLDSHFEEKMRKATEEKDADAILKFERIIKQRESLYGCHYDNDGNLVLQSFDFENLTISVR